MKVSVSNVVVAVAALFVGVALAPEPEVVTEVREVTPQALQDTLDGLRIKNEGLVAKLKGIESRPPRVILRTDTVVSLPDTVYSFVDVRGGNLTFDLFSRPDSTRELHQGVNIRDCDDGYQINAGVVLCNKARLGHLWLAGEFAYPLPSIGVVWRKSFSSGFEVYVGLSSAGTPVLRVRSGIRLF